MDRQALNILIWLSIIFAIGIVVILFWPEEGTGYNCNNYINNGSFAFQYCLEDRK